MIPEKLKEDVLARLHESHQGRGKCRERARYSKWRPRIGKDINTTVDAYSKCREQTPAQPHEPLRHSQLPGRPWEKLVADLCEFNKKQYLVTVDYYSGWIEIQLVTNTPSQAIIGKFQNMFTTHGIRGRLHTDNGPPFHSKEFAAFAA